MVGNVLALVRRFPGGSDRLGSLSVGLAVVVTVCLAGHHVRAAEEVRLRAQLTELQSKAGELSRSVVSVHAPGNGVGSGIVLDSTGLILTNSHVVDKSTRITVVDSTGTHSYPATRVGFSPADDVALLKLDAPADLPPAQLDASRHVEPGDPVLEIGYAEARPLPTTSTGTVNSLNQRTQANTNTESPSSVLTGMIALDAVAAPGDSGGAVYDADHRVIAMITGISPDNPVTFAIPIDRATRIARTWATW
ncbi:S1C family serine protease [Nocardia sp. NPDC059240]|uniref:S1C family serine protease n=1 Tax=Nocardia sp. NPDC059240 TaxID=3346786 RepID=UPI0036775460